MSNLLQVRVTGILVEDGKILLVKQNVTSDRKWSLPGGRVEEGETLEDAIAREIEEETYCHILVLSILRKLHMWRTVCCFKEIIE